MINHTGYKNIEAKKTVKMTGGNGHCCHHWIIESPVKGRHTCDGICKKCGQKKRFKSYTNTSLRFGRYSKHHVADRLYV